MKKIIFGILVMIGICVLAYESSYGWISDQVPVYSKADTIYVGGLGYVKGQEAFSEELKRVADMSNAENDETLTYVYSDSEGRTWIGRYYNLR